jgi:putative thioredoxin
VNSTGRQKEAVEELFVILKKQRNWNEDAAKKRLLSFMEMMDPKSDLAVSVRRRLANILF